MVRHEIVPYPGLADVGYLGSIPFLLAGVLTFPSRSLRTMGRARALLDGLIATSAMVFASYGTFLGVVYTASEGRLLERVLAVTYPAADLVTVAVVLAVLARRSHRLSGPLPLVGAGMVSLAVADSAFAYMTATGTYGDDPVTDLGWPLGFALPRSTWPLARCSIPGPSPPWRPSSPARASIPRGSCSRSPSRCCSTRRRSATGSTSSAPWACSWPSTTSAPATPRSAAAPGCR